MKKTLIEMVQDIINDTDFDSVNSITDTVEAEQVAQIVRTCYEKLITSRDDWPFLRTLTALNGLADTSNRTKMQLPERVQKVHWVKYNKKDVCWMPPKQFKDMLDGRTEQADVFDANGFGLNADPSYYTTYDDEYVFFDSINLEEEATLQTSKSAVFAVLEPVWTHEDTFTPLLPARMFPTLIADAKGTAFLVLKQQANAKEEQYAQTGKARAQRVGYRVAASESRTNESVNYGR